MVSGKRSGFTIFERHFKLKNTLQLQYACITISASLNKFTSKLNGRDSDPNQIENAFKGPEDGFWEKNSSEGIVRNSELYLKFEASVVLLQLNS